MKSVVTEMILQEVLNELLNQIFNHPSRLDPFTQALLEKIVTDSGIVAPVHVIVKQHVIVTIKEELNRKQSVTKEITSPPNRSSSASSSSTLDEKSKDRRSCRRQ